VADTWWNGFYPFLDFNTGGNIDGMIEAADKNVNRVSDKTIIVPGHGPVGNRAQMIEYRDMLGEVRNRIQVLKKRGLSLTEVVASQPTKSYDAKWGRFVISPALFTKMVYRGV
jgi:glyoxylase-like metal-dependent hydrolase (beta-lactamase superfamily II)